jgi:RNA-directed DNA polymerase
MGELRSPIPNGSWGGVQFAWGVPTLHDRAMQALHALALAPVAETLADPNSYGFREGRSCADALQHVFIVLARKCSPQWVLEGDIRACFDEIGHQWLLQHVLMDRQILRKWLKAGYREKGQLFPTCKGTPQGGVISPILANITLDGMQKAIGQAVSKTGSDKVSFVRYADDFIVTGATQELLEQKVKPALTAFLAPRGLELSEQKTVITHISKGFNFLGHTVRKFWGQTPDHSRKEQRQSLAGQNQALRPIRFGSPPRKAPPPTQPSYPGLGLLLPEWSIQADL